MRNIVAAGRTRVLVQTEFSAKLLIANKPEGMMRTVDIRKGHVYGAGWPSPDDRYAFVLQADEGDARLVRVDFETGQSASLIDGTPGPLAPPVPAAPYLFNWRSGLLEVREANTGTFVCAWPGVVAEKAFVTGLPFNAHNYTLVVAATARSSDDVMPSAVIDVGTLISRSQECARGTASARATLDRAMQALARPLERGP